MNVKTHPLAEILAKALFGIHGVPENYSQRMVTQAIKKAVEWHEVNKDAPTGSEKAHEIRLAWRDEDWKAYLTSDTGKWECGLTSDEAVGNLVRTYSDELGIRIWLAGSEDAVTGSVKCHECGGNITKSGMVSYCDDCCKVFG